MSGGHAPVHWPVIIFAFLFGFVYRVLTLRSDYRHYPSYPAGYIDHLALGGIAAFIGAVFIPALAAKNFTASTFLTLAATQFRDVRTTERNTLNAEEQLALVTRGPGYIEGIAKTFEERNYLAMIVAIAVGLVMTLMHGVLGILAGIVVGIIAVYIAIKFSSGIKVGDVVDVTPAKVHFEKGSLLFVEDVMLMEVGLPHPRQRYEKDGMGFVLTPKNPRGQGILWDLAQRQAIAHDVAAIVGVQKDVGYPEQTPLVRMAMPAASGKAALVILPIDHDVERLMQAIRSVPVLEASKGNALVSKVLREKGRQA